MLDRRSQNNPNVKNGASPGALSPSRRSRRQTTPISLVTSFLFTRYDMMGGTVAPHMAPQRSTQRSTLAIYCLRRTASAPGVQDASPVKVASFLASDVKPACERWPQTCEERLDGPGPSEGPKYRALHHKRRRIARTPADLPRAATWKMKHGVVATRRHAARKRLGVSRSCRVLRRRFEGPPRRTETP